jgi:hypothetical protein
MTMKGHHQGFRSKTGLSDGCHAVEEFPRPHTMVSLGCAYLLTLVEKGLLVSVGKDL